MINAETLTKCFGARTAFDGIDFTVHLGRVTGFLGPNGAGKSTTMRIIVGLDRPTSGQVTVNGRAYREHRAPLREVGVLLDAKAVHPARTARKHLLGMAATHGMGTTRVRAVIELAGLGSVADKRVGSFSLGMGQRLGIAAALLGDPATIILDEPVNGLDPEGVRWVRTLLRGLAEEGRTVLLSSHLMSEMAQTADHLIVLGRGRVLVDAPVNEVIARGSGAAVRVRTPNVARLAAAIAGDGVLVTMLDDGAARVVGLAPEQIGNAAASAGVPLHEVASIAGTLEDAYLTLTADEIEYRSAAPAGSEARR